MKRIISVLTMMFMAALTFAVKLPTGQETIVRDQLTQNGKIVAAVLAVPVVFNTSIGDINAKANSRVDFYESGALKSVYSDDDKDVTLACGTFSLSTFHTTRQGRGVPFEFYESGALKGAFFTRKGQPSIKTPQGQLKAMQATKVTFFEDGSIESFATYPNQKINVPGLTGNYLQNGILSFYKSGAVKTLTSNVEERNAALGMGVKKGNEIGFSESGTMVSFTPADDSIIKIDELMFLLCRDKILYLHDNGSLKQCTIDCTEQDFAMGRLMFAFQTAKKEFGQGLPFIPSAFMTIVLSETGGLVSVMADRMNPNIDAFPIVAVMDKNVWTAKSMTFYDNGQVSLVDYVMPLTIGVRLRPIYYPSRPQGFANIIAVSPIDVTIAKKYTTYEIWKVYYAKDGSPQYLIGREVTESPKTNFDDEFRYGIFTLKGTSIVSSSYHDDLSSLSELIFDEGGKPIAYTAVEGDALVEKPIAKK